MKPIAIIQHEADVEPGNFTQHLQRRGRPFEVIRVYAGDAIPADATAYAGLCSLGGNMSVATDGPAVSDARSAQAAQSAQPDAALPWLEPELALLRDADARGVPVIGHCLGGQLLARALGGDVKRAPHLEMGWGRVSADDAALAREWLGEDADGVEFFQWHSDAFDLPPGAQRILSSAWCANQAYVIPRDGYAHVGMQFHIEMTPELVRLWAADPKAAEEGYAERRRTGVPAVQSPEQMVSDVDARAARMYRVAAHLYDRWLSGVRA